jgi:hypothetical protein
MLPFKPRKRRIEVPFRALARVSVLIKLILGPFPLLLEEGVGAHDKSAHDGGAGDFPPAAFRLRGEPGEARGLPAFENSEFGRLD